jgi:cytoskeletal protein CcmA (bactofilin family)
MFNLTGKDSEKEQTDKIMQNNQEKLSKTLYPPATSSASKATSNVSPSVSAMRLPALPENKPAEISKGESITQDIEEGRLSGYIGRGTTLSGETSFETMLRVDGHLSGRITSDEGTLHISSTGVVDANITVAMAIIEGRVNGDITVTKKLILVHTAQVVGNIQAPRLLVEDGAVVEGTCTMIKPGEVPRTQQNGTQKDAHRAALNASQTPQPTPNGSQPLQPDKVTAPG